MVDGGVGIAAVVSIGSKFVERSKFTARHDASCDKEADKTLKMAERFDRIPQEDVDHFEFHEFNMLHSKSMEDLRHYRYLQEEYKRREWVKEPLEKFRTRGKVRHAKRSLQSSTAREERHLHDLETYSRANSSSGSQVNSCANSDTGLNLGGLSRPYRTDSCSIRALGGSPPFASLEDICSEEKKAQVEADVSAWLSSSLAEIDIDSTEAPSILPVAQTYPTEISEQDYNYASLVMPPNISEEDESNYQSAEHRPSSKFPEVEEGMRRSLQMLTDSGSSTTVARQDSPTSTSLHHHHHQRHFQNSSSTSSSSSQPISPLSTTAISHPYPLSQPSLLLSKPFRCPRPNCNKNYKQANGLKYHMTHGSCNFAPPKDLELVIKDLLEKKGMERQGMRVETENGSELRRSASLGSAPSIVQHQQSITTPSTPTTTSGHASPLFYSTSPSTSPAPSSSSSTSLAPTPQPPSPPLQSPIKQNNHLSPSAILTYSDLSNISEHDLRKVEREVERRLKPYACGVGECQRRYKNMNGLRYHYQHSGDHGTLGLALLASGQHECLSAGRRNAVASSSSVMSVSSEQKW